MLKSVSFILNTSKYVLRPSCLLSHSIQKSRRVLGCKREQIFLSFANPIPYREFNYLMTDMPLAAEKAKYLNMSLEEKRSEYYCESKFVTLKDIVPWSEHAKKVYPTHEKPLYPVNPKLNEKVSIFVGDITCLEIDAIVNAANKSLRGGGGVDGAIHRAAGINLYNECCLLHGCDTGNAKITGGYKLPAKYVIHTVGPQSEDSGLLASCYEKSLIIAKENGLRTIAFPCISTGVYGYRCEKACPVALKTVRNFLEVNESSFDRVIFCLFLPVDVAIYEAVLQEYFPA